MFMGRFLAAKCYSLLFVLVRGSSFWTGIVADIPFLCLLSLTLHLLTTGTILGFIVRSVLFSLGVARSVGMVRSRAKATEFSLVLFVIVTNVEL